MARIKTRESDLTVREVNLRIRVSSIASLISIVSITRGDLIRSIDIDLLIHCWSLLKRTNPSPALLFLASHTASVNIRIPLSSVVGELSEDLGSNNPTCKRRINKSCWA